MDYNNGQEIIKLDNQTTLQLAESMDASERACIDIQVATARAYPRDLTRCVNNSIAIATMDLESAKSCGYALPRGGKPITGPSVHLAKILAQQYGNIRVEARVVNVTNTHVVSRGMAWDLENNYGSAFEVRRSIVGKNGRFNDDMIAVTGNAANAIAYRNAIFAVVPHSITEKVYRAAQQCITGNLDDEAKLIKRRVGAIQKFLDDYGITEAEVVQLCGKQTVNQIRANEIALLLGIYQSLRDGDTTVDEIMSPIRNSRETKKSKLSDLASRAAKTAAAEDAQAVDVETGEVITDKK